MSSSTLCLLAQNHFVTVSGTVSGVAVTPYNLAHLLGASNVVFDSLLCGATSVRYLSGTLRAIVLTSYDVAVLFSVLKVVVDVLPCCASLLLLFVLHIRCGCIDYILA